jgi:galactonate dehydratase
MAESHHDVALATPVPIGPIGLANPPGTGWCLRKCCSGASLNIHYNRTNDLLDYLVYPGVFDYIDAYVATPDGPGLRIEMNEDYVRNRARIGHQWRNSIWFHADGELR